MMILVLMIGDVARFYKTNLRSMHVASKVTGDVVEDMINLPTDRRGV